MKNTTEINGQIFSNPLGNLFIVITGNTKPIKYLLMSEYSGKFIYPERWIIPFKYFPDLIDNELVDNWI